MISVQVVEGPRRGGGRGGQLAAGIVIIITSCCCSTVSHSASSALSSRSSTFILLQQPRLNCDQQRSYLLPRRLDQRREANSRSRGDQPGVVAAVGRRRVVENGRLLAPGEGHQLLGGGQRSQEGRLESLFLLLLLLGRPTRTAAKESCPRSLGNEQRLRRPAQGNENLGQRLVAGALDVQVLVKGRDQLVVVVLPVLVVVVVPTQQIAPLKLSVVEGGGICC